MWFSLGCAALATDDLEIASKAFHRCVSLDNEVYILTRLFSADLSVKCYYDEIRVFLI